VGKKSGLMPRDPRLTRLCERVLNDAVQSGGRTTKQQLVATAMTQISRSGGPSRFGIGHAWMMIALSHICMDEFTSQMRHPVTEAMSRVMQQKIPQDHSALIQGATTWLAQELGAGAMHIYALNATPDEWIINGELKGGIADKVRREARRSLDIGRFLRDQGFGSLDDMLS
jgi:hypothetical protein